MNKYMNEYLSKINNEQENFNSIKSRIEQKNLRKIKLKNIAAIFIIIIILGTFSSQLYAKFQQNIKYDEYIRRDYVSGRGEIASAYTETIEMDYVYQEDIGIKVDSIILTNDCFKAIINLRLPTEMRVDKLPENQTDNTHVFYYFGYAVYDENNNIFSCQDRLDERGNFGEYLKFFYKDLGLKYNKFNPIGNQLLKSEGITLIDKNDDNINIELHLNSLKGFPNSQKLYIRIFNIGYNIASDIGVEMSSHNDLEWIFEIETPDKFLKRKAINLELSDEIPNLKINSFTVSETGMLLQAQKKDVIKTIGARKRYEKLE